MPDRVERAPEEPRVAYEALTLGYVLGFLGFVRWARRTGRRLPWRLPPEDLVLIGAATHKISQIVARERVTRPIRESFLAGRPRSLRRAVGELLACPFCVGPWAAGVLLLGYAVRPRTTRLGAGVFAAVALSDFLSRAYGLLVAKGKEVSARRAAMVPASPRPRERPSRTPVIEPGSAPERS